MQTKEEKKRYLVFNLPFDFSDANGESKAEERV